jgi:hypothetical protein
MAGKKERMTGSIGALWGIMGVLVLLGSAVYRLAHLAIAAFSTPFSWYHWLAWVACILFMAYAEGYRGFQLHFSPRVIARARYLVEHPKALHCLFAPLFCMGYFHATRRRKIVSYSLTSGIVLLILAVHNLAQPWRGIIDGGVVIGLVWGIISILWFTVRAFSGNCFDYSPEVPEHSPLPPS